MPRESYLLECPQFRPEDLMLSDSNRSQQIDKKFEADSSSSQFVNQLFIRLVAKGRKSISGILYLIPVISGTVFSIRATLRAVFLLR